MLGFFINEIDGNRFLFRPFQCEICSKQFAALGNFQAHKKIHSGVRDQICPVCNKGFITSGDVARHMVVKISIRHRL